MEFRYEPARDHLLVVATGPFDADAVRAALVEIFRLCSEHGLRNILFDARAIRELIPIPDRFDLARDVAGARLPRVAVLVTRDNAAYTRTFENTAINRGAQVKTTDDEAEARRFLGLA